MTFYCPSTIAPLLGLDFSCAIHNLELGQGLSGTMTSAILHSCSPFLGSLILAPCSWGNMIPAPYSWGAWLLGLIPGVESLLSILGEHTFWGSFLKVEPLLPFLREHTFWSLFLKVEPLHPILGGAYFLGPQSWGRIPAPHSWGAHLLGPIPGGGTSAPHF